MTVEKQKDLLRLAEEARAYSYSPYSHYRVGAAILAEDGRIFTGCNVENASFGATICAERTAAVKAVSEGCTRFLAIAVSGGPDGQEPDSFCAPCGICRQFLSEFVKSEECLVICGRTDGEVISRKFAEYLPYGFTNLEG